MPTVIEHTHAPQTQDNGLGTLLAAILLIVFAVLLFMYGIPYISSAVRGPQVNIPSSVDVNLHNTK